jgi:hypothetical protein
MGQRRKWTKERAGFRKKEKHVALQWKDGRRNKDDKWEGSRNELEGRYEEYTICT